MTQTTEERQAAIASLLPLLEAHLEYLGRIVSRAQWQSAYEPPPPGYVPPPPEPDCKGECSHCGTFLMGNRCNLREERWAAEWLRLRRAYPQLHSLEMLVWMLGHENALWATAIRYVYLQPWKEWSPDQHDTWARLGVEWIEERLEGWVPTYEPERVKQEKPREAKRRWVAEMLQQGFTAERICKETRCSKRLVVEVSKTLKADAVR